MRNEFNPLDLKILRLLQTNCRLSISEISRVLGKPRTTIAGRLSKLQKMGIINSYRLVLDSKKIGFHLAAFIFITARRGLKDTSNQVQLAEKILGMCKGFSDIWIEEIHIVTGRYDLALKVRVKGLGHLTDLLINLLPKLKEVEHTETFLVLQTIDEFRPAPI